MACRIQILENPAGIIILAAHERPAIRIPANREECNLISHITWLPPAFCAAERRFSGEA